MRLIWSGAYLVFMILVSIFLPLILIPLFQGYGLSGRDVVGFTVVIDFITLLLMLVFGAILWRELDR